MVSDKQASWGLALRKAGIAIAVATVAVAPFYVRNWILLGSPIYPPPPVLSHFFQIKYMSPEALKGFYLYMLKRGAGLGHGVGAYLLLPFNLTYHTSNFHGAGGIGLAPLALGPLGFAACRRSGFVRMLAVLALVLTTVWFVTDQESRFLINVYAIASIFAVLGWRYANSLASRVSPLLAGVVVACSLAYGMFMIGSARAEDIHAVFSASFAQQRRQERVPFLESFEYLNSDASVQQVLILDPSVPSYYLNKRYLKPFGQWGERTLPGASNLSGVLARIRDLHVSHVLDVDSGYFSFQVPQQTSGLSLVFERADQRIYRVDYREMSQPQAEATPAAAVATSLF